MRLKQQARKVICVEGLKLQVPASGVTVQGFTQQLVTPRFVVLLSEACAFLQLHSNVVLIEMTKNSCGCKLH